MVGSLEFCCGKLGSRLILVPCLHRNGGLQRLQCPVLRHGRHFRMPEYHRTSRTCDLWSGSNISDLFLGSSVPAFSQVLGHTQCGAIVGATGTYLANQGKPTMKPGEGYHSSGWNRVEQLNETRFFR